ncbi:hypothetical protein KBZ14_06480 [Synechococcus sp. HJ21-Hayes]|nr:hypothetical protein [Synechococcus sp. JJ3a-Johnson]MCP9852517.1 hypothetical protein [Synechococcus sp. HJ21-Hayes]
MHGGGALLWAKGRRNQDDVIGLLQVMIAVAAFMVVLLGVRPMLLELSVLALALCLPRAASPQ